MFLFDQEFSWNVNISAAAAFICFHCIGLNCRPASGPNRHILWNLQPFLSFIFWTRKIVKKYIWSTRKYIWALLNLIRYLENASAYQSLLIRLDKISISLSCHPMCRLRWNKYYTKNESFKLIVIDIEKYFDMYSKLSL